MALAGSHSIDRISGLWQSLGTISFENRGPKSAVKCEIVRSEDDILTPMANLRDSPGSSGIRTVLGNEVQSDNNNAGPCMAYKPDARLSQGLKTDVRVKNFSIMKPACDI